MGAQNNNPKLALTNIFGDDADKLALFAATTGATGIEWTLEPGTSEAEIRRITSILRDFEVRYHCRWAGLEFGQKGLSGEKALELYKEQITSIARAGGRYVTVHIGLGLEGTTNLDWDKSVESLTCLVQLGKQLDFIVCLENLINGWTGDPELFTQLVESSGANATLDIGHAHATQIYHPERDIFSEYIELNRGRITGAHVYHTELPSVGHIAPDDPDQMSTRFALLTSMVECDWWVIELTEIEDILKTCGMCQEYFWAERAHVAAGWL